MSAQLVVVRDPFHPMNGRELVPVDPGKTLEQVAPKLSAQPFIVLLNGNATLRKDWSIPIGDNDLVSVVYLPRGGGGGSNPLKLVLMIAVAVVAQPLAAYMFEEAVMAGAMSSMAFNAATAAIDMIGEPQINSLGD